MMIKADREVVRSMQTDEKGMREIERARKNKGKRSVGRPISEETMAQFKPLLLEFDIATLKDNFNQNNKILKEAGAEELVWEKEYPNMDNEKPTSPDAAEHYIELCVDDNECRLMISDANFTRGQEWATKLGKPTKKLKSGELFWTLPSEYFVFGGKRYSVANVKTSSSHDEIHILWTSRDPAKVFYETGDTRWVSHAQRLKEKHECKFLTGRKKKDTLTYISMYCPSKLMKIPNKK